jgi:hypothetical protein
MAAGEYSFTIECGTDWTLTLTHKDSSGNAIDNSSYSANMDIKSAVGGSLIENLSSSGGEITLGGSNGRITLSLTDVETSAISAGRYVYDLELTDGGGLIERLIEGNVTFKGQVTTS